MQSNPMKHLEGLPPYLMMMFEMRLKIRIEQTIYEHGSVVDELGYCGYKWRSIWAMDSELLARQMVRWMMEKRINEGKQFDSILAASTKAFGHMLINNVLEGR